LDHARLAIDDPHRLDRRLPYRPLDLDGEQSIVQLRLTHLDPLGEAEAPLEPARRDAR
jgi:hypothetical protein